jgi:C4-dicarboxylate-binding protein DctP
MMATRHRRYGIAATAAIVCGIATACASGASSANGTAASGGKTYVMKIGMESAASYFQNASIQRFAANLNKLDGGQIQVKIYPNAELGSDTALFQGVRNGTIQGYIGPSGTAAAVVSQFGILDLPFLFQSQSYEDQLLTGSLGKQFDQEAEQNGFHILEWWPAGPRDIYGNGPVIRQPSDLKGVKIRILNTPPYVAAFQSWGSIPTVVSDFTEVYLALKQGTITDAETALSAMEGYKQQEVIKSVSLTHHEFTEADFSVNETWYSGLPANLQADVTKAANETTSYAEGLSNAAYGQSIKVLQQAHITIVTPDRAAFVASSRNIWEKSEATYGKDTINLILKAQGEQPLP